MFKNKGSEIFLLDFLWWSDCYTFSSRYVFLIVTVFFGMKLFVWIFVLPYFTNFKELQSPILSFLTFSDGDGTPIHPLEILKNVPVVIAYNFQKQNNFELSCQFSLQVIFIYILWQNNLLVNQSYLRQSYFNHSKVVGKPLFCNFNKSY